MKVFVNSNKYTTTDNAGVMEVECSSTLMLSIDTNNDDQMTIALPIVEITPKGNTAEFKLELGSQNYAVISVDKPGNVNVD